MEKEIGVNVKGGEDLFSSLRTLEELCESWPEQYRLGVSARVKAVEDLNKEAFKRIIKHLREMPAMAGYLKEMVKDEVIFSVLRHHGILKPTIHERIEESLNRVRPMLQGHGGDIDFLGFEDGVVKVSFTGACDGCPASGITFYEGVKKALKEDIPEIKDIRQVKSFGARGSHSDNITSPFAKNHSWIPVMELANLSDGKVSFIDRDGKNLMIFRSEERITCFDNSCAHMGMSLEEGGISGDIITCPHHGFRYSLTSGECLTAPEVQLRPYEVRVRDGWIELSL